MFVTTTAKLRMRSSVASQAATVGFDDSSETSLRTRPSLCSMGGSVIALGLRPAAVESAAAGFAMFVWVSGTVGDRLNT